MTTLEEFLFLLEADSKEEVEKKKKEQIKPEDLPDDFNDKEEDGEEKKDEDDGTGLPDDFNDEDEEKQEEKKEDKMKVDTNINADKEEPKPEPKVEEPKETPEPVNTPEPSTNTGDNLDIDNPTTGTDTTPSTDTGDNLDIDTGSSDDGMGDIDLDGDGSTDDGDDFGDNNDDSGMGGEEPLDEDEMKEKMRNISVIDNIKSAYKNLKLIEDKISSIIARDTYEQGILDIINRELTLAINDTYRYILNIAYNKKYEENLAFLNNIRVIIELIGKNLKIISVRRDDAEKK